MGGKGSGPTPQFNDPYHVIKRQQMREIRATQSELSATVKELALLQLHKVKDQKILKTGRGVSDPLPKPYNAIAEDIFRNYGDVYSKQQIENQLRQFVGHNLSQLKNQKKAYDDQALTEMYTLAEQIYIERNKAEKLLDQKFGHPDAQIREKKLGPIMDDLAKREDLWLQSMDFLKSEGYGYYVSKLASDGFVFPDALSDPVEPYVYTDWSTRYPLERHYTPKFLYNPKIVAWKAEEAEETKQLEETFITVHTNLEKRERLDAQTRRKFFEFWGPYLIRQITEGYPDIRIRKEMLKRYRESTVKDLMQLVTELREKGYKPLDGKFTVEMEVVDEEPEEKEPSLDEQWTACMARASGRGVKYVTPFDEANTKCIEKVFKMSGEQPSEKAFERVKQFWTPGYWKHHDFELPGDEITREQVNGGVKDLAYPNKAITARDLEQYCQNKYGPNWIHKRITDTADGVDQDCCISPDGNLKVIIDYRDVLRGTKKPAEPETAKGPSPAEKKIFKIKV